MIKQKFKRIVTVLSGTSKPKSHFERPLRLFQFQYAILYGKYEENLREAGTLFAGLVLKSQSSIGNEPSADRLIDALSREDCRALINYVNFDPLDLTNIFALSTIKANATEELVRMKFWLRFIELRLQLLLTAHPKLNSKNKAYQLYEQKFPKSSATKGHGVETIRDLHGRRAPTEAYLMGIDEVFGLDEFFTIADDAKVLLTQLEELCMDADSFRSIFSIAAGVNATLGRAKQGSQIARWARCEPTSPKVPLLLEGEIKELLGA